MDLHRLQQHIAEPIRTTKLTRIVKTRSPGVINSGIRDHGLIYICKKDEISKAEQKLVEGGQFKHFNEINFQNDLKQPTSKYCMARVEGFISPYF